MKRILWTIFIYGKIQEKLKEVKEKSKPKDLVKQFKNSLEDLKKGKVRKV